jgi:hypothetical protein
MIDSPSPRAEIPPYVTPQAACDSSVEKLTSQRLGRRVAAGDADSIAGRVNPTPPTLPAAYDRRIFDVGSSVKTRTKVYRNQMVRWISFQFRSSGDQGYPFRGLLFEDDAKGGHRFRSPLFMLRLFSHREANSSQLPITANSA